MNAQVGKLNAEEAQLGGCLALDSVRTDNGERLLQLCASHKLFLCSTNFRNKGARQVLINVGPKLTMWQYPTDGAAQSLTVDRTGTLLWTQTMHLSGADSRFVSSNTGRMLFGA